MSIQRISRSIPALVLSSLVAGCGSENATPQAADVGRVGGAQPSHLEAAGGVVLDVPAGALAAESDVQIEAPSISELPPLPAGLAFVGGATAFLPHGLTFDVPATIILPAAAGATRVLRLDDDRDTTWEELAGVTFSDGSATFSTPSFSIYAVAGPDGSVSARGVVDPPEVVGSNIAAGVPADAAQGLLYWTSVSSGIEIMKRARLGDELTAELVYETQGDLAVVGVGPEAVYFYDSSLGGIARLSHDLSELDATWASFSPEDGLIGAGFVSAEHLYLSSAGNLRVPLSGGSVEASPFDYPVSENCALSAERTMAACTSGIMNLVDDTTQEPRDELGRQLSNGAHASDGEAFYFTPQFFDGPVYRLPFGSTQPQLIAESPEVLSAAARDGLLFLGLADRIVTLDGLTGELLHEYALNDSQVEPNAPMHIWGDYLYYGTWGGGLQRLPLNELGANAL
ncbi:MAG TPA: hypothetical protein VNN80_17390 [Polyangiaceae bacterium]|nr:hypothetical protein [Polyangiaceae bacterium]